MPATITHAKKKREIFVFQIGSVIKNEQIRPAAKKPLYKPWLAAKAFAGLNKFSERTPLNVCLPFVSLCEHL